MVSLRCIMKGEGGARYNLGLPYRVYILGKQLLNEILNQQEKKKRLLKKEPK